MSKKAPIKDEKKASQMVLKYLKEQNRPYNATDLHLNLHKAIGKTLITKVLEALAKEGHIVEKAFGKQKIYFISQAGLPSLTKEEMVTIDKELDAMKADVKTNTATNGALKSRLSALQSTPETEEAKKEVARLKAQNTEKAARLKDLQKNSGKMTADQKEKINKHFTTTVKTWRKRKGMATSILDQIMEGYPKSKKALFEEIGVETDEEVKVSIKDFTV